MGGGGFGERESAVDDRLQSSALDIGIDRRFKLKEMMFEGKLEY